MQSNRYNRKIHYNQLGLSVKGRMTFQSDEGRGATMGGGKSDDYDLHGEHEKLVHKQQDFQLLTSEQKRHIADQHEHPYECENSPWRKQQTSDIDRSSNTYTNRY